jgi:triphosphoribosyl-dephospho-CoA synthase
LLKNIIYYEKSTKVWSDGMSLDNQKIKNIADEIGSFAIQAMLYEVSCFPSPGLVSPVSNGAHTDMNYYTFIDSIATISKYFSMFAKEGFENNSEKDMFKSIRKIGIEAENQMFLKTKGINTHKGMIFLMGIACAATGRVIYKNMDFLSIKEIIIEMTSGIVRSELENLDKYKQLSYGEKIFLEHNIKGIKGEVEAGMPSVFDFSLEFYNKCSDLKNNKRLVHTLIGIMQISDDTNIIHRHSIEVLKNVKEKAREIIKHGGMRTEKGMKMVESLSEEFVKRNISPGGSADLLGVTVFVDLVKKHMENTSKKS